MCVLLFFFFRPAGRLRLEFLSASLQNERERTDEHELEQKREVFCPDLLGSCQLQCSEKGLKHGAVD